MLHYVYYPFPESSAIGPNKTVLKRYTEKYSKSVNNTHDEQATSHKGTVLRYKGQSLSDIAADDMLMIASHGGSTDANTIISDLGQKEAFNEKERLTANGLAEQLSTAGLPTGHVLIKMLSCYASGVLTASSEGIKRSGSGTGEGGEELFFAKLLAIAMKKGFAYNKIIVGGYSGAFMNTTIASTRFQRKPIGVDRTNYNHVTVEGGANVGAHDHIYWVNGDGVYVTRMQIAELKQKSNLTQGKFVAPTQHQKNQGRTSVFKRN